MVKSKKFNFGIKIKNNFNEKIKICTLFRNIYIHLLNFVLLFQHFEAIKVFFFF